MNRRQFILGLPLLAATPSLLGAGSVPQSRIGICTFSCDIHWKAALAKLPEAQFKDSIGFYNYARGLGAFGVQTNLRGMDSKGAVGLRNLVAATGGFYEGELRLPKTETELAAFENEVRLARAAGATVARGVLLGGRRYEVLSTLEEFLTFQADAKKRLHWVEPILRRHGLKLAIENHKDLTSVELVRLLKGLSSEWIGAQVDVGNNLALLEEPYAVVEALAPFALSVHLKDMAVQRCADGFLLSEVLLGTGMLDLGKMISTLIKANSRIRFNLEMATRDPLKIPCKSDSYWATFPDRKSTALNEALERVEKFAGKGSPPSVKGKPIAQQIADEESNNKECLKWMQDYFRRGA